MTQPSHPAPVQPAIRWEQTVCNLCGHDAAGLYQRERAPYFQQELDFNIVRCRHCGLVYTNPRLSGHNDAYRYHEDYSREAIERHARAKRPVFAAALRRLCRLLPAAAVRPRLLDVGCGSGHFLALAREAGFAVTGLEPTAGLGDYARREFKLEVLPATVQEAEWAADQFDAITAFDVIEHVADPRQMLERCARWLRPGGVMALRFPAAGWQKFKAVLYGMTPGCKRWSFGAAMHLYFFSRQTFAQLARECGLEVVEFRLTPLEGASVAKQTCNIVLRLIYRLTGRIPGNLEVYCRKPPPAKT